MKRWLLAASLYMACLSTAPAEGSAPDTPAARQQELDSAKPRDLAQVWLATSHSLRSRLRGLGVLTRRDPAALPRCAE